MIEDEAVAAQGRALARLAADADGFDGVVRTLVAAVQRYYGDTAAQAAFDWYLGVRPEGLAPMRRVAVPPAADAEHSAEILHRRGRGLLDDITRRVVRGQARAAVQRSLSVDPAVVRFARVPRGAATCAFCLMLASRGFVYASKGSALTAHGMFRYHGGCDCTVAPSWGGDDPKIDGYDPDKLYEQYLRAYDKAASKSETAVLAELRRLGLDTCTDSVHK